MKAEAQMTAIDFPKAAQRAFELLDMTKDAEPLQGISAEHQAWVMALALSEFVSRTLGDQHVPPFFRFSADRAAEGLAAGQIVTREQVQAWA